MKSPKTKKLALNLETIRVLTVQERGAADGGQQQAQPNNIWSTGICSVFTSCYRDCP